MAPDDDPPAPPPSDWHGIRRTCLREARRILGPGPDADDAAQEAVVRVWRNVRALREAENPRAWVAVVARNEALRVHARRRPTVELDDRTAAAVEPPPEARSPLAESSLLDELREAERRLLSLRHEQDLSHAQIAEALGLPESTVRVRLHRVHRRLERTARGGLGAREEQPPTPVRRPGASRVRLSNP